MPLSLVLLIGLISRLINLNQSLWLDEGTTAFVSQMPVNEILNNFLVNDFHPPLYYLFMRGWSMVFGNSEIALRFPSILFSVGTVFIVYKIWKEMIGKKDTWIAPLLLATSGLFIYYSQEARMYMMSAFLVSLAVFSFVKITNKKSRLGDWVLFSFSLPLLSLSDYLPNLILLVFWILAWKLRKNKTWIKNFATSHIILVLLWLWWFPYFIKQLVAGFSVSSNSPAWWNILGKFSVKEVLLIPTKFIIGRVSLDNKLLYSLLVIFLFVIFGYIFNKSAKHFKKMKIVFLWLVVPLVLAIFLSLKIPVLTYFRLLFILPAFYILLAVGITTFKKPWKNLVIAFVLCVNFLSSIYYLLHTPFHRENWREVAKLEGQIIFPSNSQQEGYLYYSGGIKPSTIDTVDPKSDIIWLVRYVVEISDPKDTTRYKIQDLGYIKTQEIEFNGINVWKYEKIK